MPKKTYNPTNQSSRVHTIGNLSPASVYGNVVININLSINLDPELIKKIINSIKHNY